MPPLRQQESIPGEQWISNRRHWIRLLFGNDGYVTLPSNVLINWGILPKASSVDYTSVNFGQSYSNPPAVFVTWEHTSNKTGDCFQYIKSGSVTTSRFQITRSDLGYTYWIAIGKRKV